MVRGKISEEDVKVVGGQLSNFKSFIGLIKKYGPFKILLGTMLFVFASCMLYLASKPEIIFERYEQYMAERHVISNKYRVQSRPMIYQYLNALSEEADAYGTFILEFHNGKSNPSGLQWQYADMNFASKAFEHNVKDDFSNLLLDKYNIFYELYETTMWMGSIEGLMLVDKRMAYRFDIDSIQYISMEMIYGSNLCELGVLVTVYKNIETIDEVKLSRLMQKYAATISPLLDWEVAINKKVKNKAGN